MMQQLQRREVLGMSVLTKPDGSRRAITMCMPLAAEIVRSRDFSSQLKSAITIEENLNIIAGTRNLNIPDIRDVLARWMFGTKSIIPSNLGAEADGMKRLFGRISHNRETALLEATDYAFKHAPLALCAMSAGVLNAIDKLDRDMTKMVLMRFGLDGNQMHNYARAGAAIGVSAPDAREIESRAIAKLSNPCISPYFTMLHRFSKSTFDYPMHSEARA